MMEKLSQVKRKSLEIRFSGRSSDFITPSFGYGCLFKCAYCYMRRNNPDKLSIATNTDDIIQAIDNHVNNLPVKTSNQTHSKYWTYDISCNEDFALHLKYHDWKNIFNYFVNKPTAFGTFATKYVNKELLNYNPKSKIRIRFSLMPQKLADILEPNTSKIIDRIKAVDTFIAAGYDVHLNFSPVIVNKDTLRLYEKLFNLVNDNISNKDKVFSEVIFLTHNKNMHEYNLKYAPEAEKLLWQPELQEDKTSSYGSKNIRYNRHKKSQYIQIFKELHEKIIPWNIIRYIF